MCSAPLYYMHYVCCPIGRFWALFRLVLMKAMVARHFSTIPSHKESQQGTDSCADVRQSMPNMVRLYFYSKCAGVSNRALHLLKNSFRRPPRVKLLSFRRRTPVFGSASAQPIEGVMPSHSSSASRPAAPGSVLP